MEWPTPPRYLLPLANKRGAGPRASQAPAHYTTEGTSSAQPPRAQHKRAAGPPAPRRQEEGLTAGDSQRAPKAARRDVGCEGCERIRYTAEECKCNRHPNWNAQHATVKWKDTAVALEIKLLTNGELRSLPPNGSSGAQQIKFGLEESSFVSSGLYD